MNSSPFRITVVLAGAALVLSACGVTGSDSDSGNSAAEGGGSTGSAEAEALTDKRIMVPNSAGGGYDQTARTAAQVMEATGISSGLEVFNLEGAGGTVGLARLVSEEGNADLAMLMGLGVVGASYTNDTDATLTDTTPLAKLIEEPGAIMVPADSEFQTIEDLVEAWKADPGGLSVGGGSNPGGPDHLLPMQLAQAVGIDPTEVNFVTYDGGGDLLPAILGSKLDFATSGAGEFKDQIETGEIRVLAVSSEEPVEGIDAPTLTESDIDLVFTNWRGIVAPPGIEDADRDAWISALEQMHATPEWEEALETNGWTDAFITGDEYAEFLTEQDERVADVLAELGLG
ncbi:Bug family tripartite tricarboxylate transporter substrate binding protein [Ornithinimicrobium tianjinense]|uniref:C4-dicarboxylate ABC transporter substrate-binding protein n=1 Tax=Ornithinimicrobium tianjinense TaxID=1195761 RepID=A0A917F2Z3_9MICO|nr:tripartite tricarboxylate transporter substrate-binding protein [Ornithinimicrobium tianjinense]GGF39801.1 C4-dicarboxylate ABC transporter substrate-binding protein [Ornithinimicrobium tianjinense]